MLLSRLLRSRGLPEFATTAIDPGKPGEIVIRIGESNKRGWTYLFQELRYGKNNRYHASVVAIYETAGRGEGSAEKDVGIQ